ncbi:GDSL-type esterase/lipase family protein [Actinokineospora soli]|uniref:GDSL-type esterase/lipase family protein n=1 Tax=Actinokineospora soli TaxID=1048753 RepID=A0ABW2TQ51_9PSEU
MLRRTLLPLLLAALTAVAALTVAARPGTAAQAAPVRVMALGDSITGSPGCWRALLWDELRKAGRASEVDFVGTLNPDGCGFAYDGEHEGHGGFLATDVAARDQLPGWLAAARPDVVMMHFGTNDVWSARGTAQILAAFDTLVAQMRASNPAMRVLVARIIPMNPPTCSACAQRVVDLNAALPAWVARTSTSQSPVVLIDQWTGFSTATDTYDGVHPNAAGDRKIADRWYPALLAAISGVPPTTGPTTTTTTTTSTPPPGGCSATVRVVNRWPGGAQLEIVVTNTGPSATRSWSVRFALRAGLTVSNAWSTSVTVSGVDVTAANAGWNGAVAPAGSTTAG